MSCRSTAGAAPSVQSAPCSPATSASNVSLSASDTYIYRFDDQARYFDTLLELGASYSELSRTAESFLRFIDERVVWTRNAAPLWWSDAAPAAEALAWLFGPAQWASLPRTVADDAARTPWPYAALLGVVLAVVLPWRRTRTALTACGRRAAAATTTRYLPTVQGLLLTLALAAPGPAVAWLLARRLAATDDPGFAQALASGLAVAALVYLPLEILRQSAGPHGLMAAHFLWPARAVARLRRHLSWFAGAALPLVLVLAVMSYQDDQSWRHSLGRLALLALQVMGALAMTRLLHPRRGVFGEVLAAHRGGWLAHLRNVWYVAAICLPLGLAGVAVAGYLYAAAALLRNAVETLWLATLVIVGYGMVSRWVLVSRRTLAFPAAPRAGARRGRCGDGARTGPGPTRCEHAPPDPHVDHGRHAQRHLARLVRHGAGVERPRPGGAVAVRRRARHGGRPHARAPRLDAHRGGTDDRPGPQRACAARDATATPAHQPGVALRVDHHQPLRARLHRLPLVVLGVLGVTWSSIQWLVAAFGVGLGFGLQEIFANVVSGLLLLAERPVRVGDTITVGGVTGTVTRIRIRATTIQDWDLKELVVPNKDLVTGQLLNWTLSDAANRVTVLVGVAYESDADQVTHVLQTIVEAEPLVLKTPLRTVVFEKFGDSALQFSIRAYVRDVEDRLPAIHALHFSIARRFREEHIEIAFPQMDIHVRSPAPESRDASAQPLRVAGTPAA